MTDIKWIGLDWGISNLRAFAIDFAGQVAGDLSSGNGMGTLDPDDFEPALLDLLAPWFAQRSDAATDALPVFACRMVGAKQG